MKKIIFLAIILLMASPVFGKDLSIEGYQSYKNELKDNQLVKINAEAFIDGTANGYEWANIVLQQRNQQPLYCPPKKLALTTDNYINILDKQIKVYKERGTFKPEENYVGIILLKGLIRTFPCDKK